MLWISFVSYQSIMLKFTSFKTLSFEIIKYTIHVCSRIIVNEYQFNIPCKSQISTKDFFFKIIVKISSFWVTNFLLTTTFHELSFFLFFITTSNSYFLLLIWVLHLLWTRNSVWISSFLFHLYSGSVFFHFRCFVVIRYYIVELRSLKAMFQT